jgi:hypothetical protein
MMIVVCYIGYERMLATYSKWEMVIPWWVIESGRNYSFNLA